MEYIKKSTDKRHCRVPEGSRFSQWLDNTTIHGIKHVFKAPSLARCITWGTIFSVALVLLLVAAADRIRFFFEFPTATKISLKTDVTAIVFPSVTVCNLNPIRWSYTEDNNLTSLFTFLYDPLVTSNNGCDQLVADAGNASSQPLRKVLYEGRSLLDNFVLECSFSGSDRSLFDCKQNLSLTLTNLGYCYSFNVNTSAEELTVSNSGAQYGLHLILDIQQEEYLPMFGSAGVKVTIQPRGVIPEPDERGILIPPGEEAQIELRRMVIKDTSTRRRCMNKDTKLKFYDGYDYSLSTCRLEIGHEIVANYCQCLDIVDDTDSVSNQYNTLPDCTVADSCCVFASYFDVNETKCTESCNYTDYKITTSYSQFPSDVSAGRVVASEMGISPKRIQSNLVSVVIFFGDPYARIVVTQDAFTFINLLSNIGGELGLFMGVSVISLIGLGILMADEVLDALKYCRALFLST